MTLEHWGSEFEPIVSEPFIGTTDKIFWDQIVSKFSLSEYVLSFILLIHLGTVPIADYMIFKQNQSD